MKSEQLFEAIGYADDGTLEKSEAKIKKNTHKIIRLFIAAAACLCVILTVIFIRNGISPQQPDTTDEAGVTIPKMNVSLSSDSDADMAAFFIYQGRCYVQYSQEENSEALVGEYLGTATGLIDEWTKSDGYVDFAGSISGDFYSVNGFSPTFMLCMKYSDGSVSTYINDNGLTLEKGSDLFEERLNLSGNYSEVLYQTREDWFYGSKEPTAHDSSLADTVGEFVNSINKAPFMFVSDIPLEKGEASVYDKQMYVLYFYMNNGLTVRLRLFEGGYVSFDGIRSVCVHVTDSAFNNLINLLESN